MEDRDLRAYVAELLGTFVVVLLTAGVSAPTFAVRWNPGW